MNPAHKRGMCGQDDGAGHAVHLDGASPQVSQEGQLRVAQRRGLRCACAPLAVEARNQLRA